MGCPKLPLVALPLQAFVLLSQKTLLHSRLSAIMLKKWPKEQGGCSRLRRYDCFRLGVLKAWAQEQGGLLGGSLAWTVSRRVAWMRLGLAVAYQRTCANTLSNQLAWLSDSVLQRWRT